MRLSGHLPDNYADGLEVLRHMREIWDHLHQGDDGGARVSNVLMLVPKPPQGSPEASRDGHRDGPQETVVRCLGLDRLGFFPMLRHCSRLIVLGATLVGLPTAQAADTTLTLACQGVAESKIGATDEPTREPISFGLIVNLTARTIEGFPAEGIPVKVTVANEATIQFDGSETAGPTFTRRLNGTIDRVTGETWATFTMLPAVVNLSMKCRPAHRMF